MKSVAAEVALLSDLTETLPFLRELRLTPPEGAEGFLDYTRNMSENWPTKALIAEYEAGLLASRQPDPQSYWELLAES